MTTALIRHDQPFPSSIHWAWTSTGAPETTNIPVQHVTTHGRTTKTHTDGNYCFLHDSEADLETRSTPTPSTHKPAE